METIIYQKQINNKIYYRTCFHASIIIFFFFVLYSFIEHFLQINLHKYHVNIILLMYGFSYNVPKVPDIFPHKFPDNDPCVFFF